MDILSRRFLTQGQNRFQELKEEKHSPSQDSELAKNGKEVFKRFKFNPEEFQSFTGAELSQPAVLIAEPETPQEDKPVADLLDSLMNMPIGDKPQEPFPAENVTYSFERSAPESPVSESKDMHPKLSDLANSETANGSHSTFEDLYNGLKPPDRLERKAKFAVLQEHINALTEENCDLRRALELQQRLTTNLTQENQTLGDEYNIQAQRLENALKKCSEYESMLQERQEALETFRHNFEMSRSAEEGARDRVKELVKENVSLEDQLRDTKVSLIRMEKSHESLKDEMDSLKKKERQIESENRSLTDILNNIREENNLLRAQVKNRSRVEESPVPSKRMVDAQAQTDSNTPQSETADQDVIEDSEILRLFNVGQTEEMNSEEKSVLRSVHELIDALEDQRRAMIAKLRVFKAEIHRLKAENEDLSRKISNQRQHQELSLQLANRTETVQIQPVGQNPKSKTSGGVFSWLSGRSKDKVGSYID